MTSLRISIPDSLAREAAREGLLKPENVEQMLRERLRAVHLQRLAAVRKRASLAADKPMTREEIEAEIHAYRAEQRPSTT